MNAVDASDPLLAFSGLGSFSVTFVGCSAMIEGAKVTMSLWVLLVKTEDEANVSSVTVLIERLAAVTSEDNSLVASLYDSADGCVVALIDVTD